MNELSDFDMNKIIPILRSFGVSPENLGPERLEKLQRIASKISEPSQISAEVSRQVLDILGISTRGQTKPVNRPKKLKVGRNDLCSCGSKIKYKKCCGRNTQ